MKILREDGSMNAIITTEDISFESCMELLNNAPNMSGLNLASKVSTDKHYVWNKSDSNFLFGKVSNNQKNQKLKVVAIDFGIKKSILNRLSYFGCEVIILPYNTTTENVLSYEPNGIFFSNGPGDPSSVHEGINLAKDLINIGNIPMFGICLGHQIFGLALGGKTYKLSFGHRGLNHPCGIGNKVDITSQNHGFALASESIPEGIAEVTFLNLNDKTVAGLQVKNKPIFSVQYHPEAGPGPHDSDYLFEKFVSLMLERC